MNAIPIQHQRTHRVGTFVDPDLFNRITAEARASGRLVPRLVEDLLIEAYAERDRRAALAGEKPVVGDKAA